jgi:hypothetical protein
MRWWSMLQLCSKWSASISATFRMSQIARLSLSYFIFFFIIKVSLFDVTNVLIEVQFGIFWLLTWFLFFGHLMHDLPWIVILVTILGYNCFPVFSESPSFFVFPVICIFGAFCFSQTAWWGFVLSLIRLQNLDLWWLHTTRWTWRVLFRLRRIEQKSILRRARFMIRFDANILQ